ncbi:hypothetical protein BKA62DRAFT_30540 [Auriculariales sp. MPI-PUGE-AT-0066]|nr:hypothetical protein BKA62DRAFT_30540 [Auriculariales sp. MPI-PUGE-AT-0066]
MATTRNPAATIARVGPHAINAMQRSMRADLRSAVRLINVPRTAIHNDIRRLLTRNGVQEVTRVHLHYNQFRPTGTAFLQMVSHMGVRQAAEKLDGEHLSTFRIVARPHNMEPDLVRARGIGGREDGALRGAINGTGTDAGVNERGTSVVVRGVPANMFWRDVQNVLGKGFKLRQTGDTTILNIPQQKKWDEPATTKRFLIHFDSPEEAHRFVRARHRTWLPQEAGPSKLIVANVIY